MNRTLVLARHGPERHKSGFNRAILVIQSALVPAVEFLCGLEVLLVQLYCPVVNGLELSVLHPRKRRTRAPVLTGGPGAVPGGVTSKNG